jgi:hypothetical protein
MQRPDVRNRTRFADGRRQSPIWRALESTLILCHGLCCVFRRNRAAEAKANHLYYGLDPADALPRTIVAVDARLSKVIDLTDGTARRLLGVSATRMRGDDWRKLNRSGAESLTQAIGRAGYESGAEGLIVPACDGGKNLVWFPGNLLSTSKAVIRNADKLE